MLETIFNSNTVTIPYIPGFSIDMPQNQIHSFLIDIPQNQMTATKTIYGINSKV